MSRSLKSARRAPASGGAARSAVVFLHGYGADGADLLGLAEPLGPHLPDTVFLAPDAPEASAANPAGYQWFPIPWIDGSSEAQAQAGLVAAADDLDTYLDSVLDDEALAPEALALVAFSQGTMLALHAAPRRPAAIGGIVGFSGRLLLPERLASDAVSHPPVVLVHGDRDDVVDASALPEARGVLAAAGLEVHAKLSEGTGHGIAPDGLAVALAFLREKLPG